VSARLDARLLRELAEAQSLEAGSRRARSLWQALLAEGLTEGLSGDAADRVQGLGLAAAGALARALDERDQARRALEDFKVRCNRGCWRDGAGRQQ
jgi:hypothetical protein